MAEITLIRKPQVSNGKTLNAVVESLCRPESYRPVYHRQPHDVSMLSTDALREIVELLRAVLFPGYYRLVDVRPDNMAYYIGSTVDKIYRLLTEQIKRGACFASVTGDRPRETCQDCQPVVLDERQTCHDCEERAGELAVRFLSGLPELRRILATDVQAAYEGDPAAKSPGETIFCYPSIRAVTNYRLAHELHKLDVALIPRIITEMAHSETGIDIHPGAQIGEYFFIDHGTGTVIGETCVIGSKVRLYQGVTLGAKSFPTDEHGNPIKGIPRHPVVEDDVIVYSGATILGRVVIGKGSIIGGNVWVTSDVPPGTRVMQAAS